MVSKLLNPPAAPTEPPPGLDDTLLRGFEQPNGGGS